MNDHTRSAVLCTTCRSMGVMPDGHHDHAHVPSCHSNHMILNEDAMAVGIAMHAAIAHRFLTEPPPG